LSGEQRLVVSDPASVRSWNYCWLVLLKIEKEYVVSKLPLATEMLTAAQGTHNKTCSCFGYKTGNVG
jgi:hypothetical protein